MFKALKNLFKKDVIAIPPLPNQLPEPPPGERELPEDKHMGQVKLGVIVGHSKIAQGARMCEPFGLYEYSYNLEIANQIKKLAPSNLLVEVILRDGKQGEIVRAYNEARSKLCDCVVELHFNASDSRASGCETLCSPDLSDVEFAHQIHGAMVKIFGNKDRGVKTISKSARGGINVHSFPNGVNCLVEPFFGDNQADAKLGMDNRARYAKGLMDAVLLWARKVDLIK